MTGCVRRKMRGDIRDAMVGPDERSRHEVGCGFLGRAASPSWHISATPSKGQIEHHL